MARVSTILCVLFIGFSCLVRADSEYFPAGQIEMPALGVNISPRSSAMGGVGAALEDGLNSMQSNPAGMDWTDVDPRLAFFYQGLASPVGITQNYLAYSMRLGGSNYALSLNFVDLGQLDIENLNDTYSNVGDGTDTGLTFGYETWLFNNRVSLGLEMEINTETLNSVSASQEGGSLGAMVPLNENWMLGASLMHLGHSEYATELPSSFSVGASNKSLGHDILVSGDFIYQFGDALSARLGLEWTLVSTLSLRAGWEQPFTYVAANVNSGPTVGIGYKQKRMTLDYAYVANSLGGTQRIAITWQVPHNIFQPPPTIVVQVTGGPEAAQANYDSAMKLLKAGQDLDALIAFKQCLQAVPDFLDAQTHIDTISAHLTSSDSNSSMNKDAKTLMQRYMNQGLVYFKQGLLKQAIRTWEIALEVDKNNAVIMQNIQKAREQLDAAITQLREKAAQALEHKDLDGAVKATRDIFALDPEDKGAKARLETLKPRIMAEVKALNKKGVDLYVDNKVKQAIEVWKQALALDPEDPLDVKRYIQKGEKLEGLEQR